MKKEKNKQLRRWLAWICMAAVVAVLAFMPLLAGQNAGEDGVKASILSGTVALGDVSTGIQSGGTLQAADSQTVTIPSGVKITRFLVENGDTVSEGQALAEIDRVSLMNAITEVQASMEHLQEEMADVKDDTASTSLKAQTGGQVKLLYAQPGDRVQDVMLRDGCLAVISLDGLLSVTLHETTSLSVGDSLTVTMADGSELAAKVSSNLDSALVVTVEDKGYDVGQTVTVSQEGTTLGTGTLEIHNPWRLTAYSGTVKTVNVSPEQTVYSGTTLMTLSSTGSSAQLSALSDQHRAYESLMLEMFQMYQSGTITAPMDGIVSGVDKDSVHLLSGSGEGWSIQLLANAPDGSEESYINYVGIVTGTEGDVWQLKLNPGSFAVTDYADLSGVPLNVDAMTQPAPFVPTVPIYARSGGEWMQLGSSSISVGDILLFAADGAGQFVWVVRVSHADITPENPEPTLPPEESTEPTAPEETTEPEETLPGDIVIPGGITIPGGIRFPSGIGNTTEPEYQLYDLEGSPLLTLSSREEMILTITVDQQDIHSLVPGQAAQVTVEALDGLTVEGHISRIGAVGTSSGGSSKFTVELRLPWQEDMLSGMSAQALIPLSTESSVPVIPVEALVEQGTKTVVYTAYDQKTDTLSVPVEITLGASDGLTAQILSGLEVGDSFYYSYYDTLELSTNVEKQTFSFR